MRQEDVRVEERKEIEQKRDGWQATLALKSMHNPGPAQEPTQTWLTLMSDTNGINLIIFDLQANSRITHPSQRGRRYGL